MTGDPARFVPSLLASHTAQAANAKDASARNIKAAPYAWMAERATWPQSTLSLTITTQSCARWRTARYGRRESAATAGGITILQSRPAWPVETSTQPAQKANKPTNSEFV